MKLAIFKPYIASLVLLIVIGGLVLTPLTVKAIVPVIDPYAIAKLVLQLGQLVKQTAEAIFQSGQLSALVVKEYVLDPAVKLLASFMLQAVTRSIIEWIQGGGNTNFISNLQAALGRVADEAAGEFLNQLAGTNLCSPFANPLRNAFRISRLSLRARLSCTATDIFANLNTSYEEFLGDFSRGGWVAYQATMYDGNNYIDALIGAYDEKLRRESRQIAVVEAQYQAGQGFLGTRVQKQYCGDFDPETGDVICETQYVQTTPGTLVGDELKKAFSSGIDQAVNTDEIAEAIDAIISALINRLISSAQAGLFSDDEESGIYAPGLGAPALLPPPPPPPGNAAIRTDIQIIDRTIGQDIGPALSSAAAALPAITTALNRFTPTSTAFTDPSVMQLRTVRDQLLVQQATLVASRGNLQGMKTELETIDAQINAILGNPNQVPVENLAALYSRSRQISQDLSTEINDVTNPALGSSRNLVTEAYSLITVVNQLPNF